MRMTDVWFLVVCLLLTAYVALDGFDFGAGAIHRIIARDDRARREVISAIGPFWDGNEVFLLAAGGALFVAFSRVLAVALSGLYLAVILVLWAILLRGVSLEFRSHLRDPLWRSFWDLVFQASSALLAVLLGVALGAVLRGFPLEEDGYFSLELFSLESPTRGLGVIDGYTLSTGVFALLLLAQHGGRFVAMRAPGEVGDEASAIAQRLSVPVVIAWLLVTALSYRYAHGAVATFASRPWAWPLVLLALGGLAVAWLKAKKGARTAAFLASCAVVVSLLGVAAASMYPVLLRSTTTALPLSTANASNAERSLLIGLRWWIIAFVLMVGYFVNLFRIHRVPSSYGEGGEDEVTTPSAEAASAPDEHD